MASTEPTAVPEAAARGGLDRLFAPRSIAVVGATEERARIGGQVLHNVRWGFDGDVHPVSRSRAEVQGLAAVRALSELAAPPDLAIVAVAGEQVAGVVREAADCGAGGVVVLSSGFAETGEEGARAQRELRDVAHAAGMRILGPNTIGFVEPRRGVFATFLHNGAEETRRGPLALITQSGAIGAYLLRMLRGAGVGLNLMCSTGNEADVTAAEVIERAVEDPEIEVVLVCLEGTRDVGRLLAAGRRAHALGKTILALKIGTSQAGARAAQSHSGALSSDADAFRAALRCCGIVEVEGVAALARYGPLFLTGRRPAGRRLGILTTSGGLGIHMTDLAAGLGLEVPALPAADQAAIGAALPSFASAANPVDVTGNVVNDMGSLRHAAAGLVRSDGIDMALLYATNVGAALEPEAFAALADAAAATDKPVLGFAHDERAAAALMARGLPAVTEAEQGVRALAALARAAEVAELEPPREPLPATDDAVVAARELLAGGASLTPDAAFALLGEFGVRAVAHGVAATADEAVDLAAGIDAPVALKLAVGEVAHKSDLGGVVLGLAEPDAVRAAADELLAIARSHGLPERLLVQAMASGGVELFCGVHVAEGVGPVLVVGLGGTLVEIVDATETVLAADGDGALRAAIHRLCGGRLTSHRRGLSPAAVERLVELLGRVATLAISVPELAELDLNPLLVTDDGVAVVDAVAVPAPVGGAAL